MRPDQTIHPLRHLPRLLATAPGRCRLRKAVLDPVEPLLWKTAAARRRLTAGAHRVVAVTGSFGKTTTARAIRCALGLPVGPTAGPNARYALAIAFLRQSTRTPFSVFEVGIGRPGQMAPVARALRPDIVVVTSIGSEHAASMGTIERTRDEKFELVRALGPDGIAVLNGDDANLRWMAERSPCPVITFGYGGGNDIRADETQLDWPHGTRLTVRAGDWRESSSVRLVGAHMISSVLAALAVARAAGVEPSVAMSRLANLTPSPGRMQIVPLASGAWLLRDEHKSGLETIHAAIDFFAKVPARRRLVVLGEMTEPPAPQRQNHVAVGQRIAALVDRAILVGHTGKGYRTGLKRGGLAADRIVDAGHGWQGAYDALKGSLGEGDVVLLKGRHDQRLERVALALTGHRVQCDLAICNTPLGRCDGCPMLETGWGHHQPVF